MPAPEDETPQTTLSRSSVGPLVQARVPYVDLQRDGRQRSDVQGRTRDSQLSEALASLERLVVDGLQHGFFEYSISCETAHGRKRHLVIRAGKSHKFTIPENELSPS